MPRGGKSAAELRAELRALRKDKVKPISKMRIADVSAEIERLRVGREETPAAAAVPSAPLKKSKAAVESIKEAKASGFPVMPDNGTKKGMPRKTARKAFEKSPAAEAAPAEKKKSSKMAKLLKMLEEETDEE